MKNPSCFSKQVDTFAYHHLDLTDHSDKPLSLVCGGWERCSPDYVMKRKSFRYRAVEFVAGGRGSLRLAGKDYALAPGVAFSYAPGIPQEIHTDPQEPMIKYFIDLRLTLL